jgi:hypothetical protein
MNEVRLQRLINLMMEHLKPEWVCEWRIYVDSFSTWSQSYLLIIHITINPEDYEYITSQGSWKFGIIKRDISDYVREYVSNYFEECNIKSCDFFIDSSLSNMFSESYFKEIIYV